MHKPKPKYGWHGQSTTQAPSGEVVIGSRVYHTAEKRVPENLGTVIDGPSGFGGTVLCWKIKWDRYGTAVSPGGVNHAVHTIELA